MNSDFDAADEIGSLYAGNSILHLDSLGQANRINEVMIGSYTCVVDHSCSFLREGCESGFNLC